MRSRRRARWFFGTCLLCLGYGLYGTAGDSAFAHTATAAAPKITVIKVIAGKPSELAFRLSKSSTLPLGLITFDVSNEGLSPHDFELCRVPTTNAARNSCVGVKTPVLKPGQSAKLVVKITKKGMYEYVCTQPGHAAAGMKGLIGVGVAVKHVPVKKPSSGGKGKSVCPNGQTIAQASPIGDNDADNTPGGPDDADGCL
jgi:plastocyanin